MLSGGTDPVTHLEIQKLSTQLSCAIASAMKLVDQKSTCALFATVDKLDHFTLGKNGFATLLQRLSMKVS